MGMSPCKVTYTLSVEPEDVPYQGNCSAVDPETDRAAEEHIRRQLDRGNVWAWCWVKVTASVGLDGVTYEGADTLGCCSYASERAFKRDAYFSEMKHAALMALLGTVTRECPRATMAALLLGMSGEVGAK